MNGFKTVKEWFSAKTDLPEEDKEAALEIK